MFINELFNEDENPFTNVTYLDDLSHLSGKHKDLVNRVAKFHRVKVGFDPSKHQWFTTTNDPEEVNLFMRDIKHIAAAAHYGMAEAKPQKVGKMPSAEDYPTPKKFNKGMDKVFNRVLQQQVARENGEQVDRKEEQVAIVVDDHPDKLSYGDFVRIGRSGLFHIKLNGGKLPGWASGDQIAVQPHEVFAVWDPTLQGKTVVHKEFAQDR